MDEDRDLLASALLLLPDPAELAVSRVVLVVPGVLTPTRWAASTGALCFGFGLVLPAAEFKAEGTHLVPGHGSLLQKGCAPLVRTSRHHCGS